MKKTLKTFLLVLAFFFSALLLGPSLALAQKEIVISPSSPVVPVNSQETLHVEYYPNGPSGFAYYKTSNIAWTSNNPTVASVDASGKVTGHQAGEAIISGTYHGVSATAQVKVSGTMYFYSFETPAGTRNYRLYVPASYDPTVPTPLVLNYHGLGGDSLVQTTISQMNSVADKHGFIVAYPNGKADNFGFRKWNAGGCCGSGVNDVLYTQLTLDQIKGNFTIDANRVYATGLSNGAMMVHRLACELSDQIAAIAPVSGGMEFGNNGNFESCNLTRSVPVLEFHGTTDQIVPYEGGKPTDLPLFFEVIANYNFYPISAVIADWISRNGIPAFSKKVSYQNGIETCETSPTTNLTEEVTLCTANPPGLVEGPQNDNQDGGGHAWPGGVRWADWADVPTQDISASEAIWKFFSRYPLNPAITLTASGGVYKIILAWEGDPEFIYDVYRSTTPGGPYELIASGLSPGGYTDGNVIAGTAYYYVATGVNRVGDVSYSNEAVAVPKKSKSSDPSSDSSPRPGSHQIPNPN